MPTTLTPEQWAHAAEVEDRLNERFCNVEGCDDVLGRGKRLCWEHLKEEAAARGYVLIRESDAERLLADESESEG